MRIEWTAYTMTGPDPYIYTHMYTHTRGYTRTLEPFKLAPSAEPHCSVVWIFVSDVTSEDLRFSIVPFEVPASKHHQRSTRRFVRQSYVFFRNISAAFIRSPEQKISSKSVASGEQSNSQYIVKALFPTARESVDTHLVNPFLGFVAARVPSNDDAFVAVSLMSENATNSVLHLFFGGLWWTSDAEPTLP